jgi:hypothetical protein
MTESIVDKNLYCSKCKNKTDTDELTVTVSKNNRKQLKGLCKICGTTKSQFMKNENKNNKVDLKSDNSSDLSNIYYDPKIGYSGINDLQRKSGKSRKEVKEFLDQQDTYTLHKPLRQNFKRERVYIHDIDEQWQADLVEMIPYSAENDHFKYLLTVIDCFSKYAWVVPIKNKTGDETLRSFILLFKDRKPQKLQTDKGSEFFNSKLNKLFKSENVNHFSTESDKKASIVERFNRTLKEKMWRIFTQNNDHKWIDIIDDLLINYNNSYHRSIKMTPNEASKIENKDIVHDNLFTSKKKSCKFNVGDKVRLARYKEVFDKGYLPNYTTETFTINKVFDSVPTTYEIKDLAGDIRKGRYYNEDLTIYDKPNNNYKVEKILKRRTRNGIKEVFIKWYELPDKFNSWEPETNLGLQQIN